MIFCFNASADVTGVFQDVYLIQDNQFTQAGRHTSFAMDGGKGILKNEQNEIVAQGDLKYDIAKAVTIKATARTTFVYKPNSDALPTNAFSNESVEEFAAIELGEGNHWTVKDANFRFVLEVTDANQSNSGPAKPRIDVKLDKSLARASSITLPKGSYTLWGYTITVENATGTVKVAHGKIVQATDATFK